MDHLKEISAFVPETPETPLTVSVQEKPAGTVYVPVRTGTAYTGESWERGSDPKAVLSEDMPGFLEDCLMLPGGLDRLEELCKYWDTSSDEAVGRQIDETFEAMAVYDTAPGSVPEESAFEQAEDGTWEAQVEGSMGHAWCQVYEGADRGWVNKEHTPAAPGNGSAAEPIREPASGQETVVVTGFMSRQCGLFIIIRTMAARRGRGHCVCMGSARTLPWSR